MEEWLIGTASSPVDVWTTPRSQRQPHLVFGAGQLALRTGWEKCHLLNRPFQAKVGGASGLTLLRHAASPDPVPVASASVSVRPWPPWFSRWRRIVRRDWIEGESALVFRIMDLRVYALAIAIPYPTYQWVGRSPGDFVHRDGLTATHNC